MFGPSHAHGVQRLARGHSGGLSLLIAVALVVAVGSGTETARRVATTGVGLVSSFVGERVAENTQSECCSSNDATEQAPLRACATLTAGGALTRPVAMLPVNLLDLPPPLA